MKRITLSASMALLWAALSAQSLQPVSSPLDKLRAVQAAVKSTPGAINEALLEGYPASFMALLVARRLRAETDKNAISVLQTLDARLAQ